MLRLFMLVLICSAFYFSFAEELTVFPTDDMFADRLTSGTHIETQLNLNRETIAEDERIMFKFDISSVVTLESAIFNLHRYFSCPSGGGVTAGNIYPITEEWDEETWDCHTFPQYDENTAIPVVFEGASVNWFAVDITMLVEQWVYGITTNNGFVIIANMGEAHSKFDSKEAANAENWPRLEITGTLPQNENTVINSITAQNYPNPFNPETLISFNISDESGGVLKIFNAAGQIITTRNYESGSHEYLWKADECSSGIYFYNIETAEGSLTRRMTLIK